MRHRVTVGCALISSVHSPVPFLNRASVFLISCVLRLRAETMPEDAWEVVRCGTMEMVLSEIFEADASALQVHMVVNSHIHIGL